MTSAEVLIDAFERIRGEVHDTVDGLDEDQLASCPSDRANSIAWLVWHLTRIQDDHVADAGGLEQVWTEQGWADRFGLPFASGATGYGHRPDEVTQVREVSAELLAGYYEAVADQTARFVRKLADSDLDQIVDERWDPPVTLGVRLVSVIADDLEHIGQAAYVRGLLR
jgi:uncharacterized damage-inducible protein DinB